MKTNIAQIKKNVLPILKDAGIKRSALFGSFVRGEATEESDIDMLVDLPRGKTLFDLADLKNKLEEALGRGVDVLTYNSIHPLLKEIILKEQVQIS